VFFVRQQNGVAGAKWEAQRHHIDGVGGIESKDDFAAGAGIDELADNLARTQPSGIGVTLDPVVDFSGKSVTASPAAASWKTTVILVHRFDYRIGYECIAGIIEVNWMPALQATLQGGKVLPDRWQPVTVNIVRFCVRHKGLVHHGAVMRFKVGPDSGEKT
jgi:hypothetical protein